MKCKDCPAYKLDGQYICLLEYPDEPKQLKDPDPEADYCRYWEDYQKMSRKSVKEESHSGKTFGLKES
jgi:hypothetical protein